MPIQAFRNAMHIFVCYSRERDKGYRCSATCNPEYSVVNLLGLKRHSCCQSLKCGFYSFIIETESFHSHAVTLSRSLSPACQKPKMSVTCLCSGILKSSTLLNMTLLLKLELEALMKCWLETNNSSREYYPVQ